MMSILFRNLHSTAESSILVIIIFFVLIVLTRLFWGYRTKGWGFFSEFKSYAPLSHLKEIVKDPLGTIYRPLSDYLTLYFCLTFSFFAGNGGMAVLPLSVFIVLTGSPLKPYALDLLFFFMINVMFVVTRLRYSEEHRNRIYKKFGKPFIDELVGNNPADAMEIAKIAVAIGGGILASAVNNALEGKHQLHELEVQANQLSAQESAQAHEREMQDKNNAAQADMSRLQISGSFALSNLQVLGEIARSDLPLEIQGRLSEGLKGNAEQAYRDSQAPSISHGVIVDQELKETPAMEPSHDQPTEGSKDDAEEGGEGDEGGER